MAIYYFIFFNHNLSFVGGVVNQSVKVIYLFIYYHDELLSCHVQCVNLMYLESYMKERHIPLNFLQWKCHLSPIME